MGVVEDPTAELFNSATNLLDVIVNQDKTGLLQRIPQYITDELCDNMDIFCGFSAPWEAIYTERASRSSHRSRA